MMNNELLKLVEFLNNDLLWAYFIIIIIAFYALIALLTWNIKKPLIFLGIPSTIVGILLIIIRFSTSLFIANKSLLTLVNSAIKPLLISGVICIILGIAMIVCYNMLKNKKSKKQIESK